MSLGNPPIREQIAQTDGTVSVSWASHMTDIFNIAKRIENSQIPPITSSSPGNKGTVLWDVNYIYVCTATGTWKRVAINTW